MVRTLACLSVELISHCVHGRTLVGAGLKDKTTLRRPLADLVPKHIAHVPENVKSFEPDASSVTLASGRSISYDILVVATGLKINWDAIPGLSAALANPSSGVSSIYSYNTCDKVWKDVDALRNGKAIFTQPAGPIKCAGGEQSRYLSNSMALTYVCHPSASEDNVDGLGPLPANISW